MLSAFLQGEKPEHDQRLFGYVGRLALSAEVHKALGNSVSSKDGDWWFVSIRPSDVSDGFCCLRLSGQSAHIRYVYAGDKRTKLSLVRMAILKAKEAEEPAIYTNERLSETWLSELGFKIKHNRRKGDFTKWELSL